MRILIIFILLLTSHSLFPVSKKGLIYCQNKFSPPSLFSDKKLSPLKKRVNKLLILNYGLKKSSLIHDLHPEQVELIKSTGWQENDLEQLETLTNSIFALMHDHFELPNNLKFFPNNNAIHAMAVPYYNFLVLPHQMQRNMKSESILSIWAHELSHIIFFHNISQHPLFKNVFSNFPFDIDPFTKIDRFLISYHGLNISPKNAKESQREGIVKRFLNRRNFNNSWLIYTELLYNLSTIDLSEIERLTSTYRIYDELFADLVPVVLFSDPLAISKAIFPSKINLQVQPVSAQSSVIKHELLKINKFRQRDFSLPEEENVSIDVNNPHGILSNTRRFLYHQILMKSTLPPDMILSKVFKAITYEVHFYYLRRIMPGEDLDIQTINYSLINALKKEFNLQI
ncbi:MAG: hypothetical protein H6622_03440 [Halobacteriovoraceae bacterium]|nr:hypothetical protein [Halobacteriovoraceae bacterium]